MPPPCARARREQNHKFRVLRSGFEAPNRRAVGRLARHPGNGGRWSPLVTVGHQEISLTNTDFQNSSRRKIKGPEARNILARDKARTSVSSDQNGVKRTETE
jgi:hypothetical protein